MSIAYLADYHPLADFAGCVAHWRAIIYRALCDACFHFFDEYMMRKHALAVTGPQYVSPETWRRAQDARRFLFADERGFQKVCICADIDPGYLRRRALNVINDVDLLVKGVPPPVISNPFRSHRTTA